MKFLRYESPEHKLKIDYPSEWLKVDDKTVLHDNIIVGFGRRGYDSFLESLTILVLKIPPNASNTSPKELVDQNILDLKNKNPSFNLIELFPTTIAGLPAYQVLYTTSGYKTLNVCTIKGNKVYMIVYGAKPDTYQNYISTVEQMIASFEFLS
jgi:eukaryotic-like serine/threonine-protein kinase